MRLTLAGGGTDVMWYSSLKGGAWISGAIDKYVFVFLNQTEDPNLIKVSHGIEATMDTNYRRIPNPIIRECLKLTNIKKGIEISTSADASAKSGLGGSGAFEVGLLNALYTYKREPMSQLKLARLAANIEIKRLKRPVGPQDQYIAAIGGLNYFEIDTSGNISIEPLNLTLNTLAQLNHSLIFFRTGILHDTNSILQTEKDKMSTSKQSELIQNLDEIKALGQKAKSFLLHGKVNDYGATLHEHWLIKKKLSDSISNHQIDEWYQYAIKSGAIGGKIMGAGGGGWFVFYVPKNQNKFRRLMSSTGLVEKSVRFDFEGTKLLINLS
jgi:D-glycero-alpha-D-manno-heptose-7-phosphate kinase